MKKTLLLLALVLGYSNVNAQCTPDALYQDSLYGIWPDTIQNLPACKQGSAYNAELTIKTPATLIEAAGGDSTMTVIDTVLFGSAYTFQIADWPVDSMSLVQVSGLPNGLNLNCVSSSCVLDGNLLTCVSVDGVTSDPFGVYPITIWIDIYTHGTLDLGLIQYPLSTSLYEATGSYESITGYTISVGPTSVEVINSNEFTLLQNNPNPSNGNTEIKFNTPISGNVTLTVTDMFGKLVYSESIQTLSGMNTVKLTNSLSAGIYTYSVNNNNVLLSKQMIITQ
jgi:hypothetical protein